MFTPPATRLSTRLVLSATLALAALAVSTQAQSSLAVGFDSRTPPTPEYVARVNAQLPPPVQSLLGPRWPGAQGSPKVVTWSLVPDGVQIPSVIGENAGLSSLFSRLDATFASQGGRATWVQRIQESFDRWEQLSGVDFQRIQGAGVDWDDGASWGSFGSATRGDIRIAMKRIDGVGGVSVVAAFPGNGDILLDRIDVWETPADLNRVFRNSLMWAEGIACGVDLACPNDGTKLMEPIIPFHFDGPQQDDIRSMQRHYGDPSEPDDSAANAVSLGAIAIGANASFGAVPPPLTGATPPNASLVSIDADAEADYYSFDVAAPSVATVTVTPVGSTYDIGANSGGSCNGASPFNAQAVANLELQLLDTDGATVLATASSNPASVGESILLAPLNGAGTYYVRVSETGLTLDTQSYSLDVAISTCTVDTDGDGAADCIDGCPNDPFKTAPGVCGCGVLDTDSDNDGTPDCNDGCALDPLKTAPGACGCGVADTDSDGDGTPDCNDGCPNDPAKLAPGACGCGVADTDSDGDGTPDCNDGCPNDPLKTAPGVCGCGVSDVDSDGDGTADCLDGCPNDPLKLAPGACGCGTSDVDSDGDGTLDCFDGCPNDPAKTAPGVCGCGVADVDSDGDGTLDCFDGCPNDPLKIAPGVCGCGTTDLDSDLDGVADCIDNCVGTPNANQIDSDGDERGDACDNCPAHVNPDQADCDGDQMGDVCEIATGMAQDCDLNGVPDNCEPDCNSNGRVDACDILLGTSLDTNLDGIPDDCQAPCAAIQTYCTGKTNSLGCTPAIGWTGAPSVSQTTSFMVTCSNTIPDRTGQLFYGYAASFAPFQGGNLCVRPPFRRTSVQLSVGGVGCTGTYAFDFGAWIASNSDTLLAPGVNVFARWWMRDPQATFTTGFSNALTFTVCP